MKSQTGVGVNVGVWLGVAVGDDVSVGVDVKVGVGVGQGVGVLLGVGVGPSVGVKVAVGNGVGVLVGILGVKVGEGPGVDEGANTKVPVGPTATPRSTDREARERSGNDGIRTNGKTGWYCTVTTTLIRSPLCKSTAAEQLLYNGSYAPVLLL